tara:strand:- start:9633 stop:9926 length:294 start_codon:yes stop_codon:yes gene_type:complete
MINNDNGAAAMRFTQLGTVSPKQKAAIKVSAKFNSFLRAAKSSGYSEIIIISEVQETGWIKLYAKTPDLTCNYWVEVGIRGGISDEAYNANQLKSTI